VETNLLFRAAPIQTLSVMTGQRTNEVLT